MFYLSARLPVVGSCCCCFGFLVNAVLGGQSLCEIVDSSFWKPTLDFIVAQFPPLRSLGFHDLGHQKPQATWAQPYCRKTDTLRNPSFLHLLSLKNPKNSLYPPDTTEYDAIRGTSTSFSRSMGAFNHSNLRSRILAPAPTARVPDAPFRNHPVPRESPDVFIPWKSVE